MTEPKELTTEEQIKAAVDAERVRVLRLVLEKQQGLVSDYRNTIKRTGGLLTSSMTYAYSKGINDIFKLISKGNEDEKPV